MFILNKIVGGCLNPMVMGLALVVAGGVLMWCARRRTGAWTLGIAVAWFWFWGMPLSYRWIGGALEGEWPVLTAEELPKADAIVVLGGGTAANTNAYPYAELWSAADRAWHAARLYKAGKAPIIIPTGCCEREATMPLLLDMGVPESAVIIEDQARNTEENARFVARILAGGGDADAGRAEGGSRGGRRPKVLLVTSAWHMRRSVLMYRRYAPNLEIVPAATDYEAKVCTERPVEFRDFWPDAATLSSNSYLFKEIVGYWGYRIARR